MYTATVGETIHLSKKENIDVSFNLDRNNKLFFVVKNSSDESVTITTDIDHSIRTGLEGFPKNAALQFRSKDKKIIKLKDQAENGWLYADIYNSKLDFQIIDKRFRDNIADSFGNLLIASNSSISRPIDYTTGLRHVSSELRSANEFRVMWKIEINDAGIVINKEIMSDWFQCESMVSGSKIITP